MTLTPEQIQELGVKLADLRHNVNNYLSLIIAGAELIRRRPDQALRLADSIADAPPKIAQEVKGFSDLLEQSLQISR